jgi:uncharacterized protein (DUF952 family)
VIFHVVALDDWLVVADRPYAPASLSKESSVYCSPDEAVTLAVASAFYRDTPGPLMVLLIDEHNLDVTVRWEVASPVPPPGVAPALCPARLRAHQPRRGGGTDGGPTGRRRPRRGARGVDMRARD